MASIVFTTASGTTTLTAEDGAGAASVSVPRAGIQAYDADTTKNDVANTFTANQTFDGGITIPNGNLSVTGTSALQDDVSFGAPQSLISGNGFEYIFNHPSTDAARTTVALLNTDNSVQSSKIRFVKSRGAGSSNVTVADGDVISSIQGFGDDGTAITYSGSIDMVVSGTPSTGAVPTRMLFTTATTAGAVTTGIEISNTQDVSIPNGNLTVTGNIDATGTVKADGRSYFTGASENYSVYLQYNASTSGMYLGATSGGNFVVSAVSGASALLVNADRSVEVPGGNLTVAGQYIEDYNATGTSGAVTIDLDTGNNFSTAMAGAVTYTFSNAATSGTVSSFTLKVVSNGSAITWPTSVDWPAATAPTLSASGETDYFVFLTHDGGTTWYGFTAGQAMA